MKSSLPMRSVADETAGAIDNEMEYFQNAVKHCSPEDLGLGLGREHITHKLTWLCE